MKPDRSSVGELSRLGLSWAHLDRLEEAVFSSLPTANYSVSRWQEDAQGVYLEMQAPAEGVHLAAGFRANALSLDAGYFVLDEQLQRHGHATRLAREFVHVADDLEISMIEAHANLDGGSYAWAAMAGRPKDESGTRAQVLRRFHLLAQTKNLTANDQSSVLSVLNDAQDRYFMFNLSRLKAENGGHLGEDLLGSKAVGPWDWYAFWDLNDDEHRNYIIKAVA